MNLLTRIKIKLYTIIVRRVKRTNWYLNQLADKSQFPTEEWYRSHDERNFDMVNIGSSNAYYAFNYNYTNLKGFNWAGKPQTNDTSFALIKQFYSILGHNGILCIPLSPFSGLKVPRTGLTEEMKYYGILNPSLMQFSEEIGKKMGNPLNNSTKTVVKRILKDVPRQKKTDEKQLIGEEQFEDNAEFWIDLWKKEFKIDDLYSPTPPHLLEGMADRQRLMNEIIEFCMIRNIRPVLIIPPVYHTLNKYFNEKFYNRYLDPLISTALESGAEFIDMMKDPTYDSSHFYNAFFLNENGSEKFMNDLPKKLNIKS